MAEVGIFKRPTHRSVSSLQGTALFFTTVSLCNNNELLPLILNCVFKEDLRERTEIKIGKAYKRVEVKANELLSKMPEMGKFKTMIQELLWPLTYRIIRWKYIYASAIDNKFLQCFHWTRQGRIDSIKTAKYIIENKMIPIGKRFMLACSLCLKDEIHEIWGDMSNYETSHLLQTEMEIIPRLGLFWIWQLQGGIAPTSLRIEINLAIKIRSLDATKYIFSLLPEYAKGDTAAHCATIHLNILRDKIFLEDDESDIGYYIFSQMTKTFQRILFDDHVTVILLFLLYSPDQNEFFEVFKNNLDDFSETDIERFIFVICYKLHLDIFKDYDYYNLVLRVWNLLGQSFKSYVRKSVFLEHCFCYFVADYFRFILTKGPFKKSTKTSKSAKIIRHNFDKWKLLHFFIKHEIVTTASLKENKARVLNSLRIRKSNKLAWRKLLKFVNDKRANRNKK